MAVVVTDTMGRAWRIGQTDAAIGAAGLTVLHRYAGTIDAQGNFIEDWTQWDNMFKRPHAVYISPYDAQKHVWIVDDHTHAGLHCDRWRRGRDGRSGRLLHGER